MEKYVILRNAKRCQVETLNRGVAEHVLMPEKNSTKNCIQQDELMHDSLISKDSPNSWQFLFDSVPLSVLINLQGPPGEEAKSKSMYSQKAFALKCETSQLYCAKDHE